MLATIVSVVDDAIRGLTLGGALGAFVAYRGSRLWGMADPFPTITRWSAAGFTAGLLASLISGLS